MAYNTGNPIGSSDPRDLADNAQALDRALNDTALSFTDRLGQQRMTLAGMEEAATGIPAVGASIVAQEAQAAAEAARDASQANATLYPDEATGRAAVADNAYFRVVGSGPVACYIYKRINSGSSTLIVSLASDEAVTKPSWAGKKNAWPDPFFRRFDLTSETFLGKDRWWWNGVGAGAFAGWSRVANSLFNGYALRRADGYNQTSFSGPSIWLSEIDAAAGDTVTAYVLISGAAGGAVYSAYRFAAATGEDLVSIELGSMLSKSGANNIVASADPQWLRVSKVVPAGAERLHLYPYNVSGTTGFDVLAVWAFKGDAASGPSWPSLEDSYFSLRDTEIESRLASVEAGSGITTNSGRQIRDAYVPYVVWQHPLGDSEMVGNSVYGTGKVAGFYEQITEKSLINAVQARVWASNGATDIEWKVWLRDNTTDFNMSTTAADLSGSIAAGSFPTADQLYTLQLPSKLQVAANKYLFVMFRATDDTAINHKRWLYDAAITPARHGFPFTVNAGWNNTITFGSPSIGYGQTAIKLLLESDEIRAKGADAGGATAASDVSYSGSSAGVSGTNAQTAIDEVALGAPELVMPPYIYGVQSRECNVYFDNLTLADAADYNWDVTSASGVGQQQNERWTWTPAGALAAGTLAATAFNKRTGKQIATKTAQLRAAAANTGSGLNKKVMVIGDSLVSAGVITQTLLDIAGGDVMGVTLLGTRGSGSNKHEGRGGWTVNNYTTAGPTYYSFTVSGVTVAPAINATEYSNNGAVYRVQEIALTGGAGTIICSVQSGGAPLASGTLTKSNGGAGDAAITFSASAAVPGNPFWKSGAINFAQYLTDNSIAAPDWVLIGLGINDCFSYTDDAQVSALADTEFGKLDTLIASIKAADVNTKIGLMIPSPPSADQDSFGFNYGTGQTRWRFKRNILIWARQMILKYSGQEASRIYLAPSNLGLDTVNNYPRAAAEPVNSRNNAVQVSRQNNGVHPDTSGYRQIADALWAFLKFYA